ncbi:MULTISPECIES: orange carotenoid protein N-terminal domain-containing protein [unclassified Leptolyngbya]|uniref:orange carotenoid protein N-terminal domain-containing protein n=1 Tax=unclassified Leptolyngbya TaxID=2650499 RepID=UPI0016845C9E|nr:MULTISPECIES: orange carotenoid protein N-terminal domain-containing protein [unclassified Leptolyngbya]MBD1913645.1 Orange carotenoid protein [Leptolyngbya sp. FACHB-8]MBD2155506.1 Orange carotenoid protein [Leptolyngbya sp. FACHB-16]
MTFTTDNPTINRPLEMFQSFDADTKLALLWYGWLDIKNELNPDPTYQTETLTQALVDQVLALPREEQLQAQRDVVNGVDTPISRSYGTFFSSVRLDFWLLLARAIEEGTVIGVPENYQLPENTREFADQIKKLSLEDRITFTRSAVSRMGYHVHE